jgi:hypothetical protein
MTEEAEFIGLYPRVWHMAEDGAWPAIQAHGLLSTSALLDLYAVTGPEREALEARRGQSVPLSAPGLPDAIVRDQKPLSRKLNACLDDGLTPEVWIRLLNQQVYFWPSREKLRKLLAAERYRGGAQTVLTVDTASLLAAHGARVRLSPINGGATEPFAARRGLSTYQTIRDYPLTERLRKMGRAKAVAEVVVQGGVPEIASHVVAVHRIQGDQRDRLWARPDASEEEGP